MTKLEMHFEEKDYGADVSVEFEGDVEKVVSAFGSLQYELMRKLVDKKKATGADVVGRLAQATMNVAADYMLDNNIDMGDMITTYSKRVGPPPAILAEIVVEH
ncbi:MAG: hypothetical protein IKK97_03540 [Phascolarctobacterium sp.]|nr:hypothetical protein [Phascolarctobacterium sp.]